MYQYLITFSGDKTKQPIEIESVIELRAGDCIPIEDNMYKIIARYIMNFQDPTIELAVSRLIR